MAAVTMERSSVVRASTWRTGAYAVQGFMRGRHATGYPAARALMAAIPKPIHVHHLSSPGWDLRDLTTNGITYNWANDASDRGLDDVEDLWVDIEADNADVEFMLAAHGYTTWVSGSSGIGARPGDLTDVANFVEVVDTTLNRYPGRYTYVMYGQELKGGYSRSNPAEFISHYNAFMDGLKALHPTIVKLGPHMGLYGYGGPGYAGRQTDMDALIASTDGTVSLDPTNGDAEDEWLYDFIDQCWDNIDIFAPDISQADNNDVEANGRVGNWTFHRQRLKLLEAVQRRIEWMMLDLHGVTKPIYWAEKYMNVDLSDAELYPENEQGVGHVLLDLYAAQGKGLVRGCYGTNAWHPEGGPAGGSEINNYAWFSDADAIAEYPVGSGIMLPRATPFLHYTYMLEAIERFGDGKVFVDTTTDDAERIHPFCNADGEWIIFNCSTTSQDVDITDLDTTNVYSITIPAISAMTGQLDDLPNPPGGGMVDARPMLFTIAAPTSDAADITFGPVGSGADVEGLDYDPELVIMTATGQTATGNATGAILSYGAAARSGGDSWIAAAADDASATKNCGKYSREDSAIGILTNGTPTNDGRGVVTFGADGSHEMTIAFPDAPASAVLLHILVLGGFEAPVAVVPFDIPTGGVVPYTFDVTDAGTFAGATPTAAIIATSRIASSAVPGGTAHAQLGFGAFDADTVWGQFFWNGEAAGSGTAEVCGTSYSSVEPVRLMNDTASAGLDVRCDTPTLIADGIRLNIINIPAVATRAFAIIMGGPHVAVVADTKPATSTTDKLTSPFEAAAVQLVTVGSATDHAATTSVNTATAAANAMCEVGFAVNDGAGTDYGMAGLYVDDGDTTTDCDRRFSTSELLFMGDPGTPATLGTATVSSWDSDGPMLSWASSDANVRYFGGVVWDIGQVAGGADPAAYASAMMLSGVG